MSDFYLASFFAGYMGKTIAVTGGSGYLGSALTSRLRSAGLHVVSYERNFNFLHNDNIRRYADVSTFSSWEDIVAHSDVIFHLAGNTSIYAAKENPELSIYSTLMPITHLIDASIKLKKCPRIIYASTATVYGLNPILPINEETLINPSTLYDLHKWCAEKQLFLASDEGKIDAVSLRLSNVYGPSQIEVSANDRGILNRLIRNTIINKDPIYIYGDGNYLRDYIFIEDVIIAFIMAGASENLTGHAFNIGSGTGIYLKDAFHELARIAKEFTGENVSIYHKEWPINSDPIETRSYIMDISLFSDKTGWMPRYTLAEGLLLTMRHFKNA